MSASETITLGRLEALVAGDAPRTPAEERRVLLLTELRGATVAVPEALRMRVLTAAPAPRRRFAVWPSRRLVLVALPATLAIALTAAAVHGIVGSGSEPVASPPALDRPVEHGVAPSLKSSPPYSAGGGSAAGSSGALAPTTRAAAPDATQVTGAPPTGTAGRLQHTDASLQVRVPDVARLSAATRAATRIATSLGGYAQSVRYRTPQQGAGVASIELRVPAQNVREALARLSALGTLVSQSVSVDDLQHALEVQSAQVAQLRRRIAALRKALGDPALPDAQRVLLQIKLAESKRALAQRLQARKSTVAAGTTARISLVLATEKAIAPVSHPRGRAGRMLHSAVGFLGLEATVALYALIVVCPLVLVAAIGWGLVRLRRRRDENRLLRPDNLME